MKVIDLLNKIANKEEVPTYIKVKGSIFGVSYKFNGQNIDYQLDNKEYYLSDYICEGGLSLNDEVEIIKEDKKIEKLENINSRDYLENRDEYLSTKDIALDIETLRHWINKIIDYLKDNK